MRRAILSCIEAAGVLAMAGLCCVQDPAAPFTLHQQIGLAMSRRKLEAARRLGVKGQSCGSG